MVLVDNTLFPEIKMITHAISIRQPYVELILRGIKKAEYRSRPTNVRGRVYLYASVSPADTPLAGVRRKRGPASCPPGLSWGRWRSSIADGVGDGAGKLMSCVNPRGSDESCTRRASQIHVSGSDDSDTPAAGPSTECR